MEHIKKEIEDKMIYIQETNLKIDIINKDIMENNLKHNEELDKLMDEARMLEEECIKLVDLNDEEELKYKEIFVDIVSIDYKFNILIARSRRCKSTTK